MPKQNNDLNDVKDYLSRYFGELSYGIKNTLIKFNGLDELINFAVLDIVTSLFHANNDINQERFISNLESILAGIKKFHDTEKANNTM